jgi:hypothetical protein
MTDLQGCHATVRVDFLDLTYSRGTISTLRRWQMRYSPGAWSAKNLPLGRWSPPEALDVS